MPPQGFRSKKLLVMIPQRWFDPQSWQHPYHHNSWPTGRCTRRHPPQPSEPTEQLSPAYGTMEEEILERQGDQTYSGQIVTVHTTNEQNQSHQWPRKMATGLSQLFTALSGSLSLLPITSSLPLLPFREMQSREKFDPPLFLGGFFKDSDDESQPVAEDVEQESESRMHEFPGMASDIGDGLHVLRLCRRSRSASSAFSPRMQISSGQELHIWPPG